MYITYVISYYALVFAVSTPRASPGLIQRRDDDDDDSFFSLIYNNIIMYLFAPTSSIY